MEGITHEFFNERDESLEILFEGEVECVAVFEIDRDYVALAFKLVFQDLGDHTLEDLAKLFDGEKASALDLAAFVLVAAEPSPE